MVYSNTGMQRSLRVRITDNWTEEAREYNGMAAFSWNSVTFPPIGNTTLAQMSQADYGKRLEAFKNYVASLPVNAGLVFDIHTTTEAYRTAEGNACPLAATS